MNEDEYYNFIQLQRMYEKQRDKYEKEIITHFAREYPNWHYTSVTFEDEYFILEYYTQDYGIGKLAFNEQYLIKDFLNEHE